MTLCTIAAERAVIGSLLLDNALSSTVSHFLRAEDFTSPYCADLYRCACSRTGFDVPSAVDVLAPSMGTERAQDFIRECLDLAPSPHELQGHARRVYNAARLNSLRTSITTILDEADNAEALAERIAGLGQSALAAREQHSSTIAHALADYLQNLEHGQADKIDTGFPRLDNILSGLYPGQLVILGARPGVGKSAFALAIAENVSRNYGKTILFSCEMTACEIAERALCAASGLSLDTFLGGDAARHIHRIADAAGALSKLPLVINDSAGLTLDKLRATVRQHPDTRLVIVDYLGLMQTSRKDGNRNLELGELARSLKNFAAEAGIPILALSQLNRGVAGTDRPDLRSLRDSGELEQHASKVLLAWRTQAGLTAVEIAKNRRGRTGIVQFDFDGAKMTFSESCLAYSPAHPAAPKSFLREGER